MYNSSRSQRNRYQPEETGATYTYSNSRSDSWESERFMNEYIEEERRLHEDPDSAEEDLVDLGIRFNNYVTKKRFQYVDFAVRSKGGHVYSDVERRTFLDMCDQELDSYQAKLAKIPTHNNHLLVGLNKTMNANIKTYRGKVAANRESLRRETDSVYDPKQSLKQYRQEHSEWLRKLHEDPNAAEAALVKIKQGLNKFGKDNCFNYADFATDTKDGQVRSDTERSRFLKKCDRDLDNFEDQLKEIPTHNDPRLEELQSIISLGIGNYREKVAANSGSVANEIW